MKFYLMSLKLWGYDDGSINELLDSIERVTEKEEEKTYRDSLSTGKRLEYQQLDTQVVGILIGHLGLRLQQ
jgi:hypothetical protein